MTDKTPPYPKSEPNLESSHVYAKSVDTQVAPSPPSTDSLVARLRAAPLWNGSTLHAECADALEQLQRELIDTSNNLNAEIERADAAECRLRALTQAADAMRENYLQSCRASGWPPDELPISIGEYDAIRHTTATEAPGQDRTK